MVQACLASGMTDDDLRDAAKLSTAISTIREHHPTWRAPTAGKLANVLEFLMARGVLERVISITPDERSPGIPDLFLYRWSPSRRVHAGCFVEVKRTVRRTAYREPLLRAQKIAHDCLKSLGLVVHVVYLIE
jgi:hypothetical protein